MDRERWELWGADVDDVLFKGQAAGSCAWLQEGIEGENLGEGELEEATGPGGCGGCPVLELSW